MEINNHKFNNYGKCLYCGNYDFDLKLIKITCNEIIQRANTHKWIPGFAGIYFCKDCKIEGYKYNINDIITANILLEVIYSCNEYLMIKANE